MIVKKKEYEVIEKLGEHTFKVELKGKTYVAKQFDEDHYHDFIKGYNELKISGISIPKLLKKDKKEYRVLLEYIPYEIKAIDTLIKENPTEQYLKEIFRIAWYTRNGKITIDYRPHNFAMVNDRLYYLSSFVEFGYDKAKSFELEGIRYWFFTKEFVNYISARGISYDKARLKDEYKTNKEIVLAVCRYQR